MKYLTGAETQANVDVMYLVTRWLHGRAPTPYTDLAAALRPPSLTPGADNALQASLSVAADLGILESTSSARRVARPDRHWSCGVGLAENLEALDHPDAFRIVVRRALLARAVRAIDEGDVPSDVSMGLAWLASIDVVVPLSSNFSPGPEQLLQQEGLSEYISTDEQWRAFIRWASTLGCCVVTDSARGRRHVIANLAEAIDQELPPAQTMTATDFLADLEMKMPSLPGGRLGEYFAKLRQREVPWQDARATPALALGLRILEARGRVKLIPEADAPHRVGAYLHGTRFTFDRIEVTGSHG